MEHLGMSALTGKERWCEPSDRALHSTTVVGESLFLWAGNQDGALLVHDTKEKQSLLSRVDMFHLQRDNWE